MTTGQGVSKMKLGPYELGYNDTNQGIYTGDARELCEEIPDESIDLIFTDPVYQNIEDYRWLAEMASRKLKPDSALLTFCGIGYQEETQAVLRDAGRPVTWILPIVYSAGNTPRFHPKGFAKWSMLLWAGGEPVTHFCDAQISAFEKNPSSHKWTKNAKPILAYVRAFSKQEAIILDPFTGGGTVPAACKILSRPYLAFEIEPQTATMARTRLIQTPIPLPLSTPTQLNLL